MIDPRENLYRQLYTEVGRLTIFWTYLEMALDSLCYTLFVHYGGNKIEAELPRALSRKVDFVKRCLSKNPALIAHKEQGRLLIKRAAEAGEERHWLLHGVAFKHDQFEAGGSIGLRRTVHQKTKLTIEDREISLEEIQKHSLRFRLLTNEISRWEKELADPFKNDIDDASGELPAKLA